MKIHQNEITGAYYEEKKTPVLNIFLYALAGIVAGLVTADIAFGAESMTEVYANAVMFICSIL